MEKLNLLVAALLFSILSCQPLESAESGLEHSASGTPLPVPIIVSTAPAVLKPVERHIRGNGRIEAAYNEVLLAEISGRVLSCAAKNGLKVKAGETLAQIDTAALALRRARLAIQHSNAYQAYESQALGYAQLLQGMSGAEADAIRQRLRAGSGLLALEVEQQELEKDLAAARVAAPVDGLLADVRVSAGMHVRPGQELLRVYGTEEFWLEMPVLESDLAWVRHGLPADVYPLAREGASYRAILKDVNPLVGENGMVRIRLALLEPAGLMPGMYAGATLRLPGPRRVVVPKEALALRNGRAVVFTLVRGRSQWNYVRTGHDNGAEIEILGGIRPGDVLITSHNLQLSHNAPVRAKQ
ncbi:MAG: efflux RND transporter periplasmic adaptor subunit [Haliscomenobacter sp.]